MCSFVRFTCRQDQVAANLEPVWDILKVKGGDETSVVIKAGDFFSRITNQEIAGEWLEQEAKCSTNSVDKNTSNSIIKLVVDKTRILGANTHIQVMLFSRLTPEMEETSNTLHQPYHNLKDDTVVMCHGTIPNAEAIAERCGISIDVDTELFNYLPFDYVIRQVEKEGGKISAIKIGNGKHKPLEYYHNGLGLYQFHYKGEKPNIGNAADVLYDTNIDIRNINTKYNIVLQKEYPLPKSESFTRIIALYSGGLDIKCATQKVITEMEDSMDPMNEIHLWYFDWGTVARDGEILAGKKMASYLWDTYSIKNEYKVIKVKKMFKNILDACGMTTTRLIDSDAEGAGSHEAEAAISYVPYRNTFLMTLAAARAEQLYPNENVKFVIGANLSEGMIYLDNSETWLTHMNHLVKVGGQACANFEVVAPYVNRTKTEMIRDAHELNFALESFSCYFPVDGKECGKCGSCLLKENALKRGLDD